MRVEKTVFISYRRTNASWALALYHALTPRGFDVFMDYQGLASGDFEQAIVENIRSRAHFLVVLTPSALERCHQPGDWFRREIEEAMDCRRNIVPLMLENFDFGAPTVAQQLTGRLTALESYNGLTMPAEYFEAALDRLCGQFLKVPLEAVLQPISKTAQEAVKTQQAAAATAPAVTREELTAQNWFERGYSATDPDEKIRYYTNAIRLDPSYAAAYNNRGNAHVAKGDHDAAIADFTEALQLDLNDAVVYYNRGLAHYAKGDPDAAIADYDEAIRLDPNDTVVYNNRGYAHNNKGDHDATIADYTEALRLDPDDAVAYNNRGYAHAQKGDFDAAIVDCNEALRLDPANAAAYDSRSFARGRMGDYGGAIADCNEALRLDPDYALAYNNRGYAHDQKGDHDAAIADYQKYLNLGGGVRYGDQTEVENIISELKKKL